MFLRGHNDVSFEIWKESGEAFRTVHVDLLIDLHHLKKNCEKRCRLRRVHKGTLSLEGAQQKNMKSRQNQKAAKKVSQTSPPGTKVPSTAHDHKFRSWQRTRQDGCVSSLQTMPFGLPPLSFFCILYLLALAKAALNISEEALRGGRVAADSKDVDHLCLIAGRARPPPVN